MTWTLKGNDTAVAFTFDQAADRLIKRRVAKDKAEAEAMLRAAEGSGNAITLPETKGGPPTLDDPRPGHVPEFTLEPPVRVVQPQPEPEPETEHAPKRSRKDKE